jgi:hypothetical protein
MSNITYFKMTLELTIHQQILFVVKIFPFCPLSFLISVHNFILCMFTHTHNIPNFVIYCHVY